MKVLCTIPYLKPYLEERDLSHFEIVYKKELDELELDDYEAVIGFLPPEITSKMNNLKLFQLGMAGSDFLKREDFNESCHICNASGTFGTAISEYMIGGLISLMRNFPYYHDNQKSHTWHRIDSKSTICDSNVLVVGLGDIGSKFAYKCHAFGARVNAIRRHPNDKPEYVDKCGDMGCLKEFLKEADVVALCLPNNSSTSNILGAEELKAMKRGSYLINVGRGNCLDYDALVDALSDNIAGALLDVFKKEPLEEDNRLWNLDNVIITPHSSGNLDLDVTRRLFVDICEHNLKHMSDGDYLNEVDFSTGYRTYKQ